ncbi:MAG: leucyl aminopeptidase [Alphaproteobacteria bacterium]|nr:leucyl aminopeptidase [Alphaproteobacteria bacterium]
MITIQFVKEIKKASVRVVVGQNEKVGKGILTATEQKTVGEAIKQAHFLGKDGQFVDVFCSNGKIVMAGIGDKPSERTFCDLGGRLATKLSRDAEVVYYATGRYGIDDVQEAVQVAYGSLLGAYRFDKYLTKTKPEDKPMLKKITIVVSNPAEAKTAFKEKQAIVDSIYMARDLCSEPANVLTPKTFADKIADMGKLGLDIEILTLKELKAQKFNMLLSVAQGSSNEPRVAVMKWMGNPKKKAFDLGLVGKGVTFDSGGISLKPGAGMGDMKQDMTGAAVVSATMRSMAIRKVKSNVIGIVGLVENMPSGSATRPGDIVKSLSGQTVEILNTDAEGRLVLGDCLWYMQEKYGVKKIIDLATLTGAVMVALGEEYAGLFTNDDTFAEELTVAGKNAGEPLWRLPMNKAYNKMLDSDIADMKNIGGRVAGGSTAACFLGRFIKDGTTWAHLDIAGVDKFEKSRPTCPKGATGWGVGLLNNLIK